MSLRNKTIAEALREGKRRLQRAGKEAYAFEAELLLEKAAARPSYAAAKAAPPKPRHTFQTYIPQQRTASALPSYQKGEMVQHDAFGTGMSLSVMPTGNDAMLEIAFDQVGTKHLMAKAASQRMKKL